MPHISNSPEEHSERKDRARLALAKLRSRGYSPQDVSHELEDRISWRTLYRWQNGEKVPKRKSDVLALEALALKLCS